MDDKRLPDILRVCREALARQGTERGAYLDVACADDRILRSEVDLLLAERSNTGTFLDAPPCGPAATLAPGTRLGPYAVLSLIGEGGMGQVYRASDTRLDRTVAIKVLPPEFDADPGRLARFEREAKTIAGLNHPHICTLHDVGDEGGMKFLVMEFIEGQTLAEFLRTGPPPVDEALRVATEIADAVAAAHRRGVIHRDLKPANVMLGPDGAAKVLDFGLATSAASRPWLGPDAPTVAQISNQLTLTRHGVLLGTAPYMSPEQAEGGTADERSDVFSFGAVLYELLTGRRAFPGDSPASTMAAVLRDQPEPVRQVRPGIPRAIDAVVARCLEKRPERRYASAVELHDALVACQSQLAAGRRPPWAAMRQPRFALPALGVVVALAAAVSWSFWQTSRVNWARLVAMPQIEQLLDEGRSCAAFRLVRRAERYLPNDPEIDRIRRNWTRRVSFLSDPAGADVYVRDYLDAADEATDDYLGRTPLEGILVPAGNLRYRISKAGLESVEGYTASAVTGGAGATVGAHLYAPAAAPAGMVRVMAQGVMGEFWLDKYEVTNRRFREFVDAGGYETPEAWREPFIKNGQPITWDQAVAGFQDPTGRHGPATWYSGTFPRGQDDYPVHGVSWYEAAAFCAFEGKSLPTVHHWRAAALQPIFATILTTSNFSSQGPARVGAHGGLGPFGTYDTAGNVREWCLNASGDKRNILGGAWNDPKYLSYLPDSRSPFDRSSGNGFRCAKYEQAVPPDLATPMAYSPPVGRIPDAPANDTVFQAYKSIHTYERGPLNAKTEAVDDSSPSWRMEKVSFSAGYGNERVTAYLFLPKNAEAPLQAVVTFPGTYAFDIPSSARLETQWFDFITRSGRAVVHPIYKGTYERSIGGNWAAYNAQPAVFRDLALQWFKDLGRSLDYLETRPEIDREKLAYHGISIGAVQGPRLMALEPRLKAGLLFWGGLGWGPSVTNSINYAQRSAAPTLMVNGRADLIFPFDSSQVPLFRLLGASGSDKRHLVLEDAGHVAFNQEVMRQSLAWLDKYLGPVKTR